MGAPIVCRLRCGSCNLVMTWGGGGGGGGVRRGTEGAPPGEEEPTRRALVPHVHPGSSAPPYCRINSGASVPSALLLLLLLLPL